MQCAQYLIRLFCSASTVSHQSLDVSMHFFHSLSFPLASLPLAGGFASFT